MNVRRVALILGIAAILGLSFLALIGFKAAVGPLVTLVALVALIMGGGLIHSSSSRPGPPESSGSQLEDRSQILEQDELHQSGRSGSDLWNESLD